jgi:hypothetical protein
MKRIALLVLGCLLTICLGNGLAGDPVSPLFQARLDATKAEWERGGEAGDPGGQDPTWWPASANPMSFCLGSVCLTSYCLGSFCMSSHCVGSGCVGSTCLGSGCAASLCVGSGCVGSICGGSACLGVSLCPKKCHGNDGAANRDGPDYGGLTYTWGPCRD